jgi:hypothetical protein
MSNFGKGWEQAKRNKRAITTTLARGRCAAIVALARMSIAILKSAAADT